MSSDSRERMLAVLNRSSVEQRTEPFSGLDWDAPESFIDADDARWLSGSYDPLVRTTRFAEVPGAQAARYGLARVAGMLALATNAESLLQIGLLTYAATAELTDGERQYVHHEVGEESRHTQMFAEFVRRAHLALGPEQTELAGHVPLMFREVDRVLTWSNNSPAALFLVCLSGEEPFDALQRMYLRAPSEGQHPLLAAIYRLHVAEEARHLRYARASLDAIITDAERRRLRYVAPLLAKEWCRSYLQAPPALTASLGVPPEVLFEAEYQQARTAMAVDLMAGFRSAATSAGLVDRNTEALWRNL